MSFSCRDAQTLNDGTALDECVKYFTKLQKPFAIGANCTAPKYISEIIKTIKKTSPNKKIVIYPNSGEKYNPENKTWLRNSKNVDFVPLVNEWIDLGADIIGGCCRIGPEQIKKIKNIIQQTEN